jgi:hypothetical protein
VGGGKGSKASKKQAVKLKKPPVSPKHAAVSAGWFLSTRDQWARPYFDPKDLKCADRILFGQVS